MDLFEKAIHVDIQSHVGEQPYRLGVIIITGVLGALALPYTALIWIVTAWKIWHYTRALREQGWFGR